jgi:phosphatidylserine synthase
LITIIFSTVIAILFLISIPYTSFADNIRIIWSNYIVISFIALIVIQLFISMLMPTIIIGKNTPKQILTR